MTIAASWISDTATLYTGDATDTLAALPSASAHCVVTSPPYWGPRDYGTGTWIGGDPDCPHTVASLQHHPGTPLGSRRCPARRIPEVEHPAQTDEPEPWSFEEDRVLQRYPGQEPRCRTTRNGGFDGEGWHTGPIPYGYRPHRIRISPADRRPRYRTRLLIEPVEASVVKMIFLWRVNDGLSVDEIVHHINSARYPAPICPGASEPDAWISAVVQAILGNPKYIGYQVWAAPTTDTRRGPSSGCGRVHGHTRL